MYKASSTKEDKKGRKYKLKVYCIARTKCSKAAAFGTC